MYRIHRGGKLFFDIVGTSGSDCYRGGYYITLLRAGDERRIFFSFDSQSDATFPNPTLRLRARLFSFDVKSSKKKILVRDYARRLPLVSSFRSCCTRVAMKRTPACVNALPVLGLAREISPLYASASAPSSLGRSPF